MSKKRYNLEKDKHIMNNVQMIGTVVTTGLLATYYAVCIDHVNPQLKYDLKIKLDKKKQEIKNWWNGVE